MSDRRDLFAAAALNALLGDHLANATKGPNAFEATPNEVCWRAWMWADKMVEVGYEWGERNLEPDEKEHLARYRQERAEKIAKAR